MQALHYRPLPTEIAQRARRDLVDEFGHNLAVQPGERAPCRHCLRITQPHEPLVLLSYRPFSRDFGPYSESGPIFVHADNCERYERTDTFPPDFQTRALVLRAYNAFHEIADSVVAQAGQAETSALKLFENPDIRYIHARNVSYGCYNFAIERGTQPAARTFHPTV